MARAFGSGTFGSGQFGGGSLTVLPGSYGVGVYGVSVYGATSIVVNTPTVSSTSFSSISLAWTSSGGVSPITYAIQRAPNVSGSAGTYATIVSGIPTTTYTVLSLAPSTTYWFRIIATDAVSTTSTSAGVSATTTAAPVAGVTMPSVICELSLTDPTLAPAWVDITRYLKSFSTKRGRNFELDRTDAGTATVVLDNSDGRFNPLNTSGPYYGKLKRYRRIQIRALWGGAIFPVFSGYITQLPQTILGVTNAEVSISLTDGFVALAQCVLNITYGPEMSHVRLGHVLDDALWTTGTAWKLADATLSQLGVTTVLGPAGDRAIGLGQSMLDAATLSNTTALQHIQDIQATEDGWTFIAANGSFVFYGRNKREAQFSMSTFAIFGDRPSLGEYMYADITLNDDVPIYNTVQVSRSAQGSVPQTAMDTASRSAYFVQSLQLQSLLTNDGIAGSMAAYYVNRYKQPAPRVGSLVLDGTGDPTHLWPHILGRDIADPVTVNVRPPGGAFIAQPSWIEGVEQTWTAEGGLWLTTWHLSPVDMTNYWILGTGVLGSTTSLAVY